MPGWRGRRWHHGSARKYCDRVPEESSQLGDRRQSVGDPEAPHPAPAEHEPASLPPGPVCPHCGETTDIFKSGGAQRTAEVLGTPFLGSVPLDAAVVEDHRQRLLDSLGRGAANGIRLLESLYQRPIISVADVRDFLGISHQAANVITHRMVDLGLIQEITGKTKHRRYRYEPYIALFVEG